ncbi:MAG: hypothetical protein KBB32_11215 [Spirochaetia bacterium]|nr:hypothetical protein [Spirochaetia bacterium]
MDAYRLSDIEAKSGLGSGDLPEPFMVSLYRALAPYRGCGHGCAYCDGRAEKYYVDGEFERDLAVRRNVADRIRLDVEGGKATLDYDVLSRFPSALIMVTLTTTDDGLAAWLEPGASPPSERLAVVRSARKAGFMSGVMAMPLCPGLCDDDEHTDALATAAQDAGAQFVCPGHLTLRPGRQKDFFMCRLAERRPDMVPHYHDLYRENRQSGSPLSSYLRSVSARLGARLAACGMPASIPWSVYSRLLAPHDALFVLLCHMDELYARRGVNTEPLRDARGRYASWLKEGRRNLRRVLGKERRRTTGESVMEAPELFPGLPGSAATPGFRNEPFPLSAELARLLKRDLESVLQNDRLAALCRSLATGQAEFDYCSMKAV